MKDSVQHQAKSYLSFKKEQAEKRKIEKLQKELETPNLSLDEYLKIAEDLGEENLTAEQREIVGLIKANKKQGEILKGVGAGLWEFTKDTATGLWNVLMTPPEQVLYDMGAAVINYDETYAQISAAIASSYERDMVNGNDYTRARWVTYAIATVGTSLVSTKGVDKVGKAGFDAWKNTVKNVKEAAAVKLNQVNNTNAFATRYGFAGGFEGVPYNTVDSLGLRDQLIIKAGHRSKGNSSSETQGGSYLFHKGMGKEYKSYKAVEYTGTTKINGKVRDISRRVFQRLDIDYERIDPKTGMTNLQLMKKGRAPIGEGTTLKIAFMLSISQFLMWRSHLYGIIF
ncbi:hypothetical protein LIT25_06900 [Bacillus sp. F19]|nr:hypothetical protein LIT25_06900 [Bacillus sp. F19]